MAEQKDPQLKPEETAQESAGNAEEKIGGTEENASEENASEETETETAGGGGIGNLLSPEAIIMLPMAVVIDIISLIPVVNIASDVLGMIIIGPWMFLRSGSAPEKPQHPMKSKTPAKNVGGKILRRLGLTTLLEFIPIVSMFPWWTITVWNVLKD